MLESMKEKWMLKSEDSFGKHLEILLLAKKQEGKQSFYQYESQLGRCNLEVCCEEGELLLERLGEDRIHLQFSLKEIGTMFFKTAFYEQEFEIEALSLEEGENFLNFSYRILDRKELINEIHVQMKRRDTK